METSVDKNMSNIICYYAAHVDSAFYGRDAERVIS